MQTSAFARIKECYDFYFVPLRLLWRYAPQMLSRTNEAQFAASESGNSSLPTEAPSFNNLSLYKYLYLQTDKYPSTDTDSSHTPSTDYDAFTSSRRSIYKLLSYLGYLPAANLFDNETIYKNSTMVSLQLSPWKLLAYQKIYQDFYRNSQWEAVDPLSFNIDYLTSSISLESTDAFKNHMCLMRLCNYPTDYFQGLLPNTQYGDVSTVGSSNDVSSDFSSLLSSVTDPPAVLIANGSSAYSQRNAGFLQFSLDSDSRLIANGIKGSTISLSDLIGNNSSFSILQLRQAEATQRYREITQSQAKDYPSQMNAHFDSNTSAYLGNMCQYLGGTSSVININDIENNNLQSNTVDDVQQGQAFIAGKGTNSVNGHISFEAKEHGVIMCIYHALPMPDYNAYGVKREDTYLSAEDYPMPEFDQVGMQPTYNFEFSSIFETQSSILGYAPRFAELKTDVDDFVGDFADTLSDWIVPFSTMNYFGKNLTYQSMKCYPTATDSIFAVGATTFINTDPLLCNAYFDVKAIRPFDRNGLPY